MADIQIPVINAIPDTLKIGTLYDPQSYFLYRTDIMGDDYSLAVKFCEDKGLEYSFIVGASLDSLITMLCDGKVDLLAYDIPHIGKYISRLLYAGREHSAYQVIVQRKDSCIINDVIGLKGKDVYVEVNSKYYHRLQNLNKELGNAINICGFDKDSLSSVEIIEMVSDGIIPYTVVDSDVAAVNKGYFPNLDFSLVISFPQKSSWGVTKRFPQLVDSINNWFATQTGSANKYMLRNYFELSRMNSYDLRRFGSNFSKGYISEYDSLFKKIGGEADIDWRLLAAISYAESKFNNQVTSYGGAKGVMQIMPSTARAFGVDSISLQQPDQNIKVACRILQTLDKSLSRQVPDKLERLRFIIGAYNSGIAHIRDAIAIAELKGYNASKWEDNVAVALKLKSDPEIYNNDDICKYGYFNGQYTVAYVNKVMDLYEKALSGL